MDRQALSQELGELVAQLEGRISRGTLRSILPAKVAGETRWYGFSPTDREQRMLAEELGAWLGPPISSGPRLIDSDGDELDRLATDLARGSQVLRLNLRSAWRTTARNNVIHLTNLWDLAPERGEDIVRPVGRVLRQFYESIRNGSRDRAEETLAEIADRSLLSPTNRRFLRVELLGSLGTPQELRDQPEIDGLTSITLPPAVREHLAQAANDLYIAPVANETAPDWQSVVRSIETNWPSLCERVDQARSAATARCLALNEASRNVPRPVLIRFLLDEWGSDSIVSDVLSSLPPIKEAKSRQQDNPLNAYRNGEYLTVLQSAENSEVSIDAASLAMAAAVNLDDVDAATRALTLADSLQDEVHEELMSVQVNRSAYHVLVERVGGTTIPVGWIDWLQGDWIDRPDRLKEWKDNWGRPGEVSDQHAYELALELVEALDSAQRGRVRNGLPMLVDWLLGEETEATPPTAIPVLAVVAEAMLTVDPGPSERSGALDLIDEVLSIGSSTGEYVRLLDALDSQLDELGPREAPWLSACLDTLFTSTCNDPLRRKALLSRALGVAIGWGLRLDQTDALVIEKAFEEAGLTFVSPSYEETERPESRPPRTFGKVGIYTLHERSARVVEGWIKERWQGVEVSLSSAHVRTNELVAIAQSTDVFLVQTSRAKHPATNAIVEALDDPNRLVYVNGRGASAIFRCLLDWQHNGHG